MHALFIWWFHIWADELFYFCNIYDVMFYLSVDFLLACPTHLNRSLLLNRHPFSYLSEITRLRFLHHPLEATFFLHITKACVTSALRQPCTYPRRQISGFRAAASRCSILHRKTAVRKIRSQGCRNEFSTCSFSLRFACVF